MEGKPLIESVHEAIYTLYHDPDSHKKNEANRWLIEFQKTVRASDDCPSKLQFMMFPIL